MACIGSSELDWRQGTWETFDCAELGLECVFGDGYWDADSQLRAHCRGDCDPTAAEGCEPPSRCAYFGVATGIAALGCVPLDPADALEPGEPCEFVQFGLHGWTTDCPAGHACLRDLYDLDYHARCLRLCSNDRPELCTAAYPDEWDEGVSDGVCVGARVGDISPCARPGDCDPICQDCGSDAACYRLSDGVNLTDRCASPGRRGGVGACIDDRQCLPGHSCIEFSCRPICDLTGESDCIFSRCPTSADGLPMECRPGDGSLLGHAPDPEGIVGYCY